MKVDVMMKSSVGARRVERWSGFGVELLGVRVVVVVPVGKGLGGDHAWNEEGKEGIMGKGFYISLVAGYR